LHAIHGTFWRTPLLRAFAAGQGQSTTARWAPLLSPASCPRHAPRAPLGYESFEDHSTGCSPLRNRPIYRGRWLLPHRQPSRPVSSGVGSSREQTVSIPLHHIPTGPGSAVRADVADHNPELVLPRDQRAERRREGSRRTVGPLKRPLRPEPKDPPPAPPTVGPATSTRDQQALGQSALARQRFRCCWLVNDRVVKWLTGVVDTYVETIIRAESTRDPTFAIMVIVSGHRGCGASL
jgi:hypothetical protein